MKLNAVLASKRQVSAVRKSLLLLVGFAACANLDYRPATAQSNTGQTDPVIIDFLSIINKNVADLSGKHEEKSVRLCRQIVSSVLDLDALARSAGDPSWQRMSSGQQRAYVTTIERRVVRDCALQNRNNDGTPFSFVGMRQGEGGDRLLATRSGADGQVHTVIWRLRREGRHLRAVDIIFDGRSIALSLRDETNALLERHSQDLDAMIKALGL